jgi:hypothetical protein
MENLKLLQDKLLRRMSTLLEKLGFDKKIRGQSFWKNFDGGRASVHLSFIRHTEDFDITVDVAIRFDDLEDLVNAENPLLTKKEKADTFSLGVELGNLIEGRQKRWTVKSENDIDDITNHIMDCVVKFGMPYIERYSVKENVFNLLVKDDDEAVLHSPFQSERAKRVNALAKLLNKTDYRLQ